MRKVYFSAFLLLFLFAFGLAACSQEGSDQETTPTISLNPQGGGANTAVQVFGQNFPVGTTIMIRLGPPDVGATPFSYGSAVADENGRFVVSFLVPEKWPDDVPITQTALTIIAINEDGSLKATAPFAYQPGLAAPNAQPDGDILTPDSNLVMDEEAIVTAVTNYLVQTGETTQTAISVEEIEGEFARVRLIAVTPDSAGDAIGFLKQIDSTWQVLVIGRDFDSDLLVELGIPTTILPEELLAPAG